MSSGRRIPDKVLARVVSFSPRDLTGTLGREVQEWRRLDAERTLQVEQSGVAVAKLAVDLALLDALRPACPMDDSWGDPCEGFYEIAQSEWRPCPYCDGEKGKPGRVKLDVLVRTGAAVQTSKPHVDELGVAVRYGLDYRSGWNDARDHFIVAGHPTTEEPT